MLLYKKIFLKFLYSFLKIFINLKKSFKLSFLLLLDVITILFSIFLVSFIFDNSDFTYIKLLNPSLVISIFLSILIYFLTGQYNSLSKYINSSALFSILSRNILIIPIFLFFNFFKEAINSELKVYFLFWFINSFMISFSRFALKEANVLFEKLTSKKNNLVAIYGAGAAGAQLANTLTMTAHYKIIAFFDDSKILQGRKLYGIPIYSPNKIITFKDKISQVLFAIPSLDKKKSVEIIKRVQNFEIPILKVPSIEALTKGIEKIDSLRPIEIEDLLGREKVEPRKELLESWIKNKNICISGAAGSIGTELCKQVINYRPKSLIMIDSSETNLYNLEEEISQIQNLNCEVKLFYFLGNVKDFSFLRDIFFHRKIDIVYHAAAYKHVPIIEKNPLSGIDNNVFSTLSICQAAVATHVKKIILISSDKAVRPKNIMGASKRLSELIFQAFTDKFNYKHTNSSYENTPKFSIVRFGNVLNSSGSVVPLFKKQILSGGPLTLTHKDIIRYFMTVPEAAQLVIQATSLSQGGEVFLLDMGNPMKILDLAKQMIRLSGFSVKDKENPNGDIEIIEKGLRPGEKLYEELLIDAESQETEHPLIFKANESYIPYEILIKKISSLENYINNRDTKLVLKLLSDLVPEWRK